VPDWVGPVADYMFHEGLKNTARIAVFAVLGSTVFGIILGTLMTIRFLPLHGLIRLYIEVWRGSPVIHHRFGVITGAVIGLGLWGSAQVAEATRGAVQSIPREQHEAAAALGFGWFGRHRSVILPQALRRLLPPLVSLLANVIQNTTIASLIGVPELLATGQRSIERLQFEPGAEPHHFAIYGAVLAAFFCISFPLTRLAIFLERRLV
jgi:polar amino acid transport system permease protein